MSSPLTTAGDIWIYSTSNSRLPIGTNGQVLVARSSATTGLAWETQSGGGDASMIYIAGASATTNTDTTVTVSNIPQTASDLLIIVQSVVTAGGSQFDIRYNASTAVGYEAWAYNNNGTISAAGYTNRLPEIAFSGAANTLTTMFIEINSYTNSTNKKSLAWESLGGETSAAGTYYLKGAGLPPATAAITSLAIKSGVAIGTGGFIYVDIWGAKRS